LHISSQLLQNKKRNKKPTLNYAAAVSCCVSPQPGQGGGRVSVKELFVQKIVAFPAAVFVGYVF
jgi:hypothetical protein